MSERYAPLECSICRSVTEGRFVICRCCVKEPARVYVKHLDDLVWGGVGGTFRFNRRGQPFPDVRPPLDPDEVLILEYSGEVYKARITKEELDHRRVLHIEPGWKAEREAEDSDVAIAEAAREFAHHVFEAGSQYSEQFRKLLRLVREEERGERE